MDPLNRRMKIMSMNIENFVDNNDLAFKGNKMAIVFSKVIAETE